MPQEGRLVDPRRAAMPADLPPVPVEVMQGAELHRIDIKPEEVTVEIKTLFLNNSAGTGTTDKNGVYTKGATSADLEEAMEGSCTIFEFAKSAALCLRNNAGKISILLAVFPMAGGCYLWVTRAKNVFAGVAVVSGALSAFFGYLWWGRNDELEEDNKVLKTRVAELEGRLAHAPPPRGPETMQGIRTKPAGGRAVARPHDQLATKQNGPAVAPPPAEQKENVAIEPAEAKHDVADNAVEGPPLPEQLAAVQAENAALKARLAELLANAPQARESEAMQGIRIEGAGGRPAAEAARRHDQIAAPQNGAAAALPDEQNEGEENAALQPAEAKHDAEEERPPQGPIAEQVTEAQEHIAAVQTEHVGLEGRLANTPPAEDPEAMQGIRIEPVDARPAVAPDTPASQRSRTSSTSSISSSVLSAFSSGSSTRTPPGGLSAAGSGVSTPEGGSSATSSAASSGRHTPVSDDAGSDVYIKIDHFNAEE